MPKEYFKKKGQSNSFKMKSPFASHDGTESATTHYADGSPKDDREIEFSERHEEEVSKGTAGGGETEGQDEDKIFDNEGNQVGYWKGDTRYSMDGSPMRQLGTTVDPTMLSSMNPTLGGAMNDPALMYKKKKGAPKMTYQSPKGDLTKDR